MTKRLTLYKYSVYFRYKEAKHLDHGQIIMKESESESRSVLSDSLRPHELYSQWNSPRKPIFKPTKSDWKILILNKRLV